MQEQDQKPKVEERPGRPGFRTFFLRGLAVLLPSVVTLWLLWAAFGFVQRNVAEPINGGLRQLTLFVAPRVIPPEGLPEWFATPPEKVRELAAERARIGQLPLREEALRAQIRQQNFRAYWDARWYLRIIGLVVAIVLIYLAGRLVGGFIGRGAYERAERYVTRVPVIKQVYPSVKQVVEFALGEKKQMAFSRVVLVEYPRKGMWSLGLMTGPGMRYAEDATGLELATIFMPSSPTPFTGYTISVPRREVIDMPITIDEAVKFVVSGGVLAPGQAGESPGRPRLASGPEGGKMGGEPADGGGERREA